MPKMNKQSLTLSHHDINCDLPEVILYVRLKPIEVPEPSVWKRRTRLIVNDIVKLAGICEPAYLGDV